jgi:hypothetical protein
MESGDLYVRIGPRSRGDHCPLLFRSLTPDSEVRETAVPAVIARLWLNVVPVDPRVPNTIADHIKVYIDDSRLATPGADFRNLLLDIRAPDLYAVDWEGVMQRPGLPAWEVARFRDDSDKRLLVPFELPVRVLQVERLHVRVPAASNDTMRYYRTHRVAGLDNTDFLETLRRGRYDIVHAVVVARWRDDGVAGEFSIVELPQIVPNWIGPAAMRSALLACGARFLVLQCEDASHYEPMLDVAHRLLGSGGPTTVVVDAATPSYLDELYMAIVHDSSLDSAARNFRMPPMRVAVFENIGGASVLQISPLAQRLSLAAARSAAVLDNLTENAVFRHFAKSPSTPSVAAGLEADFYKTTSLAYDLAQRTYNYANETGAWIPLAQNSQEFAALQSQIEALSRKIGRVVNVGLIAGDDRLPARATLEPSGFYQLAVQIGLPMEWTLIRNTKVIPEGELVRQYSDDGVELRVLVFAPAFELADTEYRLMLPRPPRSSSELRIDLRAPPKAGRHRIRVGIYHRNNLLQSVLMHVHVQAADYSQPGHANIEAEVEFALSETLTSPWRMPARTVNFLSNARDDGTHTFVIVGDPFRKQFDFDGGQMNEAVGEVRKSLYSIAADTTTNKPKYRFDANNCATVAQLEQDLASLAELGYALYTKIVTAEDSDFENKLQRALGASGSTIQVSATKSAQYVFPWALVYDQPLVVGQLSLCPQFAMDLQTASSVHLSLANAVCLAKGCPHREDVSIVCPSGFWGFKHLIEQPLSVASKPNAQGSADVVLDLNVGPGGMAMPALMAISRQLEQVAAHAAELRKPSSFQFLVKDTKAEVGLYMKDAALAGMHLIYFYCHGGRERSRTWLGIGSKERLVPSDLHAWKIDWTGVTPLVFINGCHTADLTPDDLLNFNQVFGHCRAAGVIGTEIDMPEGLARDFARGFFEKFGNGSTVGEALQHQRLSLLERCNLLGLAYTAYCSSSLRLVHT